MTDPPLPVVSVTLTVYVCDQKIGDAIEAVLAPLREANHRPVHVAAEEQPWSSKEHR